MYKENGTIMSLSQIRLGMVQTSFSLFCFSLCLSLLWIPLCCSKRKPVYFTKMPLLAPTSYLLNIPSGGNVCFPLQYLCVKSAKELKSILVIYSPLK